MYHDERRQGWCEDDGTLIGNDTVNLRAVARKFYLSDQKDEDYNFLSIFTTFQSQGSAYHDTVRNNVTGVGGPQVSGDAIIKNTNLLGINFLNNNFSPEHNQPGEAIKNNLFLLVHETAHQWGISVGYDSGLSDGVHYTKWVSTGFEKNGQQWGDVMGGWPWKS